MRAVLESNQPNRVCNPVPKPIGQLPILRAHYPYATNPLAAEWMGIEPIFHFSIFSPSLTFQTVHVTINLAPCYVVGDLFYRYNIQRICVKIKLNPRNSITFFFPNKIIIFSWCHIIWIWNINKFTTIK